MAKLKSSKLIFTATALSIVAIGLTFSRGAWLPLVMVLFFCVYERANTLNINFRRVIRCGMISGILLFMIPAGIVLINSGGPERSLSAYNRIGLIIGSLNSIAENPIIGRGLGSHVQPAFSNVFYDVAQQNISKDRQLDIDIKDKMGGKGRQTHNTFLEIAVDLGLAGFVLYIYMLYSLSKKMSNSLAKGRGALVSGWGKALLLAFAASTICSIFFSGFLLKQTWVVAGLLVAGIRINSSMPQAPFPPKLINNR